MTVAYPTSFQPARTLGTATALVVASSEGAAHRGRNAVEEGSYTARCVPPNQALAALEESTRPGMLWVELETIDGDAETLLRRIDRDSELQHYPAVIATGAELIDPVSALITSPRVEVVIGRSDLERAAALALSAIKQPNHRARESSNDENAARLRQLSEEVSRIAASLARLSGDQGPSPVPPGIEAPPTGDLPAIPADTIRTVIRARRARGKFLPPDLLADPAWDILLDLLQAELVQHRVPVSSLCIAAAVPATTALRWIKTMTDRGLLVRRPDPHDGRRVFMEMTRPTSHAIRRFFAEVGPALV